jgi:hypothetical protein
MRLHRVRIAVLASILCIAAVHAQFPSTTRISGAVVDAGSAVLPGVKVEISGGTDSRVAVTDEQGRYAFDSVRSGTPYALTFTLPGFRTEYRERVTAAAGQTAAIDIVMRIGCLAIVDFVAADPLDELLMSDAVVSFRISENGRDREIRTGETCYTGNEAPAIITNVVHASRPDWRPGATIELHAVNHKLRAGEEYLAFMNFDDSLKRFVFDSVRFISVANGLVEWYSVEELGFRDGAPVRTAVQRLRDIYTRYTRYRRYDSQEPTTSIERLRHKTGWVAIGAMALTSDIWKEDRPFELVDDPSGSRALPRRNERIRLKTETQAHILDFGWRGEALRDVSPTTRPRGGHISDLTGARVAAGVPYVVTEVQFEPIEEADARIVWFKLVAR